MTSGNKQRHFTRLVWGYQDYSGKDFKNLKGFAFLVHPCKAI